MSAAPGRQRTMADRRHASWFARLCQGGGDALWLSVAVGVKVAEVSPACPQGQAGLYVRAFVTQRLTSCNDHKNAPEK